MSVQSTARLIDELTHDTYRDVWNALDCRADLDSGTAALAALAAQQAVRAVLIREMGCNELLSLLAERTI